VPDVNIFEQYHYNLRIIIIGPNGHEASGDYNFTKHCTIIEYATYLANGRRVEWISIVGSTLTFNIL
jgi:hypothetical protein